MSKTRIDQVLDELRIIKRMLKRRYGKRPRNKVNLQVVADFIRAYLEFEGRPKPRNEVFALCLNGPGYSRNTVYAAAELIPGLKKEKTKQGWYWRIEKKVKAKAVADA